MYFFFSKVLLFVILPGNWILALLVLSFILKNKKVRFRLRIAAVIVYWVFSCPLVINILIHAWDVAPEKLDANKPYSCAIVLGGFSTFNGDGSGFFNPSSDRFIQTLRLKTMGKAQTILITGGSGNLVGNKKAEAPWVKQQLIDLKVPAADIFIEDHSKNTLENAEFSRDTLVKHGINGPYILVTSAYHMRRSLYIFRKAGLNVVAYPCNYLLSRNDFTFTDLLPEMGSLGLWNIYMKEVVGYIVAHFQKIN